MDTVEQGNGTGRLLLDAAPAGLSFVQDLLNSAAMPVAALPDLLGDRDAASAWLDASLRTWSEHVGRDAPVISIGGRDVLPLRELRVVVRSWLASDIEDETPRPVQAHVWIHNGALAHSAQGDGAPAVASLVYLETLLAAHSGTLKRLKTCLNPACGAAFYDQSRNGTRVWHDMKTCGNTMNLRASRARRRDTPQPD